METARRISRNAAYLGAAEIISRALQFAVMLAAARFLSQGDFGKFNFALSLAFIAMILADLGINQLLVRTVARNKKALEKYVFNGMIIKVFLALISGLLVYTALGVFGYAQETRTVVYIIWLFAILGTFTELLYSIFRAFERMEFDSALKIARMVLLTSISIVILLKGMGVVAFSIAFVAVEAVVVASGFAIASTLFMKKQLSVSLIDASYMKRMLCDALPFGLAIVFGSIYFYISGVMLSVMEGDVAVALFSSAYNIVLALLFIPTVYTNAIYPVLCRYYASSKENLELLYDRSFKYLLIAGLPISVGLYALSDDIIALLYGESYAGASLVLKIISGYIFLKFLNFHLGITLYATNRQKQRMWGQGITALVNILLNLFLIPRYGIAGAAISTLITEIVLFGLYYAFMREVVSLRLSRGEILKPLIAALSLFAAISYIQVPLIPLIIAGAMVYGAVIIILKTFDSTDWRIVKGIMGKNAPPKR
ncbi:MAG TPA: flippase [Candidatus Nanoarchaeia archaeon]|nr:flippase [Candidatus Nanoarchaeia archaeon]